MKAIITIILIIAIPTVIISIAGCVTVHKTTNVFVDKPVVILELNNGK